MSSFNQAMLTLARESRGMSQADLARTIGVSQGKISKYEAGLLAMGATDLVAIAETLGYALEFFAQDERIYGLGSSALFHRQRKAVPMAVQRKVQADLNIVRLQSLRLLKSVDVVAKFPFPHIDVDSVDGDPTKAAEQLRMTWRMPAGPVENLTNLIENAGGLVARCEFGSRLIDAAHLWLDGEPPLFFVNAAIPGDRLRFTLAHELGHAVMHTKSLVEQDIETEANQFAAEFLMPAAAIRPMLKDFTLQRAAALKPVWKVAIAALVKRARDLDCITENQYRSAFTRLSALGYKVDEPLPLPIEEPTALRQLIEVHRKELGYSDAELFKLIFRLDAPFLTEGSVAPSAIEMSQRRQVIKFVQRE